MYFEVSAKRPVARRDKACAAAQAGRPGQGAQRGIGAPQGASRRVGRQRCGAGATQHPLRTADGQRISILKCITRSRQGL